MDYFVDQILSGADAFGSWEQHVLSWMYAAKSRSYHFIRYEDLVAEPSREIERLARYLGVAAERWDYKG